MNEQIKQLASKALDQSVPETWTTLTPEQLDKVLDKFGELLVQACANQARNTDLELIEGGDSAVLQAAQQQMLEHFGV